MPFDGRLKKHRIYNTLYRLWDRQGRLLYVGITFKGIGARLSQHQVSKTWWPDVAEITVVEYPDERSVRDAETAAIRCEKPIHNVLNNRFSETSELSSPGGKQIFAETLAAVRQFPE